MRNLFGVSFFFLFFVSNTTMHAQRNLTEKVIVGEWQLSAFHMSGVYWDFAKDSLVLAAELKAQVSPGKEKAVEEDIKRRLESFKEGHIKISPDKTFFQAFAGDSTRGNYTLVSKDNKQYLRVVNDNAEKTVDDLQIWKDRGWLYMSFPVEKEGDPPIILMFERK